MFLGDSLIDASARNLKSVCPHALRNQSTTGREKNLQIVNGLTDNGINLVARFSKSYQLIMRTEVIKADTIDEAIEGLLNELNKSRQNVIYFDGWEGLGACAVLRAIARCLELKEPSRPPGLDFEQVIHIDCSKWESTRALQREVAKQLKLSNWVMKMFDKQDEEDDFNGITDQGSRAEIADVAIEIQRSMQGRRFLAVLHNGGNEEIDISRLGLALYPYLTNKVIWTFQGRFRMDPKMKDKVTKNTTDVLLSASCSKCDPRVLWFYLLDKEAAHVACKHGISLTIVVRCFLCLLDLNCIRGHHVDTEYDLTIHTCNYWICDGIIPKIPGCGEEAWQDGENLQGEIRLDMHYHQNDLPPHLLMYNEKRPHWTSPAYGYVLVQDRVVPSGMLQHFDKLSVIKLSGVKTLDLGEVRASTLPKRFILVGCEKLRAILWPQGAEKWYGVLFIDQTSALASSNGWEEPHADRSLQQQKEKEFEFGSRISLMDTRLLRSLSAVRSCLENSSVHIDIYTAATVGRSSDNLLQAQPHTGITMDSMYIDVLKDGPVTAMMMWDCPEILPGQPLQTCIMKVMLHGHGSKISEDAATSSTSALSLPEFIFQVVRSLHMYDNSSTTTILAPPKDPAWTNLRWCRVERCPALRTVFNVPQDSDRSSFSLLETFWASQLLSACYIWTIASVGSFSCLTLLHLDRCPRLIHVLPLSTTPASYTSRMSHYLFSLETLEIVDCGDLREVFPLSPVVHVVGTPILFPKLRRIHLHWLPSLQRICGRRVFAPKIETIKIRGCWSLRRLPGLGHNTAKPPEVDCEKDWWDNLEWDGVKENHHPSLYEPSHSLYYKAKVPRHTVLR
ncbi:hypothetical protein ZWY2020_018454 [Hordeum vulgare]|nr:hypothetical protein ZWY2020_018454 [Hordeum vulgare]